MSLPVLPGLGPQLQKRILERDRNGSKFLNALQRGAIEELMQIQGVSRNRAITWIQVQRGLHQDDGFLATPKAKRLHEDMIGLIQAHAGKQEIRDRIGLLGPLANVAEARSRLETIQAHMRQGPIDAYQKLARLQDPKPQSLSRTMVAENDEVATKARAMGLDDWAQLVEIEELRPNDLGPFQLLYRRGEVTVDGAIESDIDSPLGEILPEWEMAWVHKNRSVLAAMQELGTTEAGQVLQLCDDAPAVASADLEADVAALRNQALEDWKAKLRGIQVPAEEYLEQEPGRMPPTIQRVLDDIYHRWDHVIAQQTGHRGLLCPDADLTIDQEALQMALRNDQESALQTQHQARSKNARQITRLRPLIIAKFDGLLEAAVWDAVARFAKHHALRTPRIGGMISFHQGLHMGLGDKAEPIEYQLGQPERLALLTGANSGGKSTFLELLAQMALLARMGLPVPAQDAVIPWFGKLHFVSHTKTLDAGAFESLLRSFQPLLVEPNALVLLDEVEAVTEPEAASRILAFFLERLERMGATAIVVTHMAPSVIAHARIPLRVDGIEATGLDEMHRLIVNRCPKQGHMARSTPELIVRRLSETTRGDEQVLFQDLLQHLAAQDATVPPHIRVQS